MQFEVGEIVTFPNKTGKYIGKVVETSGDRILIEALAVLKHPLQGDLHAPKQANVGFFQERKALAYREKVRLQPAMVRKYEAEVPEYKSSLVQAVETYKQELTAKNDEWARLSLNCLNEVAKAYEKY